MNLNSKGKLAKFYMWLPPADKKLPQDLCTFFWGLVGRAFFIFGLGGVLLGMIVCALVEAGFFVWAHKVETLVVVTSFGFMALLTWLSERKKKKKFELFGETRAIIRAKVDGLKGRYCPRINWK